MTKSAALRIRIAPELHREFLEVCQLQDLSASHVLRQFMRSYVDRQRKEQQTELFDVNDKQYNIEK
jgi:predicted transcriptional regulator